MTQPPGDPIDDEVVGDLEPGPVEFDRGRGVAFRPGQILVTSRGRELDREADEAAAVLRDTFGVDPEREDASERVGRSERLRIGDLPVVSAVQVLRAAGITAQPNHVLFADCCCGPHPAWASGLTGDPFSSNPFSSNPFSSNPFSSNPFSSNPFSSNPFSSNPFSSNPWAVHGNPALAQDPERVLAQGNVNLARPSDVDLGPVPVPSASGPRVGVLDVAMPDPGNPFRPNHLSGVVSRSSGVVAGSGGPDLDGDGFLDKVAGHGVFVAGRVTAACPGAAVTVLEVMTNQGVGDERTIARALRRAAGRFDVVNLSFSAYALQEMRLLAEAVLAVQVAGGPASSGRPPRERGTVVVASAGNDATCAAPYPAVLPEVVSVAALGPSGPAPFTNYGPWVRACAAGVDVPSAFFDGFQGAFPRTPDGDPDHFHGVATWSGTSFAAPLVAGKLASLVADRGLSPRQAVRELIDAPGLARLPMLGTVVTV